MADFLYDTVRKTWQISRTAAIACWQKYYTTHTVSSSVKNSLAWNYNRIRKIFVNTMTWQPTTHMFCITFQRFLNCWWSSSNNHSGYVLCGLGGYPDLGEGAFCNVLWQMPHHLEPILCKSHRWWYTTSPHALHPWCDPTTDSPTEERQGPSPETWDLTYLMPHFWL